MAELFYRSIVEQVGALLGGQGYHLAQDDGLDYYTNGETAVSVDYEAGSQQLRLRRAKLAEGEGVDWLVMSSWLLPADASDRDKQSVANDFADSLNEMLGVKVSTVTQAQVDMPVKRTKAEVVDIEGFTARFLAVYPARKADYKAHVQRYGAFLFDTFFGSVGVQELVGALSAPNQKQANKLMELFADCYAHGDEQVTTVIVYTLMAGALVGEPELTKTAMACLEKHPYLHSAVRNILALLKNPQAAQKYLVR